MKTLVVSTDAKMTVTRAIWDVAKPVFEFDHVEVKGESGFQDYFSQASFDGYDRVVADVNLRRLGAGYKCLKGVPGLVIFEHDVYQQYVRLSEWYRRFPAVLKDIGKVRIIVSGYGLAEDLRKAGIDAQFLAKGYDDNMVRNLGRERNVETAFVGRVKNKVYRDRKRLLERMQKEVGLQILRADPGEPYNNLLNDIRFFVSADVGYNEYMIKNFEAMAAGCVLLAWRQPDIEQEELGLVDGEHVVLYSSVDEFKDKLKALKSDPAMAEAIALAGQKKVEECHTWRQRVDKFPALLEPEIGQAPSLGLMDRFRIMGA